MWGGQHVGGVKNQNINIVSPRGAPVGKTVSLWDSKTEVVVVVFCVDVVPGPCDVTDPCR
jgi:hypothetical protein